MVVLVGSGHVAFGLGVERQAALWYQGRVASVIPVPVSGDHGPARVRASYADFVWGVPPEAETPLFPALGVSLVDRKGTDNPVIADVVKGSPADTAGLKIEDRIVSLDDEPVPDKEAFVFRMAARRWGDAVSLTVERSGDRLRLTALLRRRQTQ
jgi:S1-C subfamily serine protease